MTSDQHDCIHTTRKQEERVQRYDFVSRRLQTVEPVEVICTSDPGRPVHSDTNSTSQAITQPS